tara:strand:+ start:2466 stop:2657 length:192 start_codon:yes stop_codon:yes gene_type:complete
MNLDEYVGKKRKFLKQFYYQKKKKEFREFEIYVYYRWNVSKMFPKVAKVAKMSRNFIVNFVTI